MKLWEIAQKIEGIVFGDKDCEIRKITNIEEADEESLVLVLDKRDIEKALISKAKAIIIPENIDLKEKSGIKVKNFKLSLAKALELFAPKQKAYPSLHPSAIIGKNVKLGQQVSIGAYVVIEEDTEIGDRVVIMPQSYIGQLVKIGSNTILHPQVVIKDRTIIGQNVKIHSGTVIGSDGFGYVQNQGNHYKIPQNGNVIIEDEVEIGSGVTIDRATIGSTVVGSGSKIDNLVHIAHNVKIGRNCIIVAQVGISGSVTIGDGVIIAGQVGIVDHVSIGKKSIIAARSVVTKDLPENSLVSGFPAKSHQEEKKIIAAINRLPKYLEKIRNLEKKIQTIEKTKDNQE
ncbi:UDP-3-O-(3-hydroxymyristoyl)glucosamine N-acyltransferase [bacterium]|nr:UDP-3-O-(3-hydroxymyristoyl)glucosamine N-acyltransferase [bacterium]